MFFKRKKKFTHVMETFCVCWEEFCTHVIERPAYCVFLMFVFNVLLNLICPCPSWLLVPSCCSKVSFTCPYVTSLAKKIQLRRCPLSSVLVFVCPGLKSWSLIIKRQSKKMQLCFYLLQQIFLFDFPSH